MERFEIEIADLQNPMEITVNTKEEKAMYLAAQNDINHLFSAWSQRFTGKPSKEILAMIAIRLAYVNVEHNISEQRRNAVIDEIERSLDSVLLNTDSNK
ncbi:MAG: cell division protein ZapA [Bacteroidales bacterium]|nr:cell division protein ZapA [Bacteroidales bacterium]